MHYLIIVNNIYRIIKIDQNHDNVPFLTNEKITCWFSIPRENDLKLFTIIYIKTFI